MSRRFRVYRSAATGFWFVEDTFTADIVSAGSDHRKPADDLARTLNTVEVR